MLEVLGSADWTKRLLTKHWSIHLNKKASQKRSKSEGHFMDELNKKLFVHIIFSLSLKIYHNF